MKTLKAIVVFIFLHSVSNAQKFYFSNDNDSINNAPGNTFLFDSVKQNYFFQIYHANKNFSLTESRFLITDKQGSILKQNSLFQGLDTTVHFRNIFQLSSNLYAQIGTIYLPVPNSPLRKLKGIVFNSIDSNLQLVTQKNFFFQDSIKLMVTMLSILTSRKTIIVTGTVFRDTIPSKEKVFLLELDANGDSMRYAEFGTPIDSMGRTYHVVERTDTAGYILINEDMGNVGSMYYIDTNFVIKRQAENKLLLYPVDMMTGWVNKYVSLQDGSFINSQRSSYKGKHWHLLLKYHDDMRFVKYVATPHEADSIADNAHMPAYVLPLAYSPQGGIYSLEGTRTDANATYNFNNNYILVCRYDTALNLKWSRFLGGDGFNYVPWTISTAENGSCMVLCARRNLDTLATVLQESFIFKFDTLGTVTSVINVSNPTKFSALVFPNPSINTFTFWMQNASANTTLVIYDLHGKLLHTKLLVNGSNVVDMSNLSSGQYYYSIISQKGEKLSGKLLKQ